MPDDWPNRSAEREREKLRKIHANYTLKLGRCEPIGIKQRRARREYIRLCNSAPVLLLVTDEKESRAEELAKRLVQQWVQLRLGERVGHISKAQ